MEKLERFLTILEVEGISMSELARQTGTTRQRWSDIKNQKVKIRLEDFEHLCDTFPQYEDWLYTGREHPSEGQIRPSKKS